VKRQNEDKDGFCKMAMDIYKDIAAAANKQIQALL
jgi:hypothetical protein